MNIDNNLVLYQGTAISDDIVLVIKEQELVMDILNSMIENKFYYSIIDYQPEKPDPNILERSLCRKEKKELDNKTIKQLIRMRENIK